ncbi:hypothetical protein SS50377_22056 [Spironucleus salmonicida]|uniref:Uncharacterized protein n=1 Tax=Spironucleus salmonicida TaxID=348837 RepID=V6LM66_9EUKA|nr:hypothetical protein SS50377_22056 [Spironucleus salmonicida]|eukprot:EST45782.1 Hypothetical protein SS50377_14354 [Spironucleus salmonicida]
MIYDSPQKTNTLVIPVMLSQHKDYPYIYAQSIIPVTCKQKSIFISSIKHNVSVQQQIFTSPDISILQYQAEILELKLFIQEMKQLISITQAASVLLIFSVPNAMKISPDQHAEIDCVRRIGWKGDIKELGVTDVFSWMRSFGVDLDSLKLDIDVEFSAVVRFE